MWIYIQKRVYKDQSTPATDPEIVEWIGDLLICEDSYVTSPVSNFRGSIFKYENNNKLLETNQGVL